ncbi:unnamed protein product [Cercopithifilaria johnstoni]|uniref:PH-15 domain-containing protein n=1 Tax=Cercopithifilaria johnstoni TaxID=2874296 RepID=A0A8J2MPH6_9BILA|nr:unnamed protein product [Cercopithifilaria johnstoni]
MRLFRHNDDYITLPDQEALFSLPYALFGHVEKRSLTPFGWRWRKRAIVLNPSGHLIIYKYFLKDIGAGKPFLGRIIHLDAVEHIQARMDKDVCHIKIHDHTRKRTELRIKGTKARLWAAKIFMRSTAAEIKWPIERPLKVLDSKISTSSIYDIARGTKVNHMEEFSKIAIASLSSESFPDYTTSDASQQKTQLSAQILDVEGIRKSDVFTAGGANSESNNVEIISVQSINVVYGKSTHKKFETNLLKRSRSASEFTTTAEFSTIKEAHKSVSLDQLNEVLISRQGRFRKHLQNIIESRFYDSLTKWSSNYSVSSIQKLHTQAGNLRMSQIYIPYNTLLMKDEMRAQHQQRSEPLSSLSIDINSKLWKELKHDDKDENDTAHHF